VLEGLVEEESTTGFWISAIVALKKACERAHEEWKRRWITERFAYLYADGIHVSIRLGEDWNLCPPVLIGVSEAGEKWLLGIEVRLPRELGLLL
jgi:transposase-like protein